MLQQMVNVRENEIIYADKRCDRIVLSLIIALKNHGLTKAGMSGMSCAIPIC